MEKKTAPPSHPYRPKDLYLPHYVPNDRSVLEILSIFFSVVGVVLIATWIFSGTRRHLSGRFLTRVKICWFVLCGLLHIILEGYFVLKHKTLAGEQSLLSQMWKEYGMADSRYVSGDTCIVVVEGITAVCVGPLSALAAVCFLFHLSPRYMLQMIVSVSQLYGTIIYYLAEIKDGFKNCETEDPFYFWFYLIFMNMFWIIVPLICIAEAGYIFSSLQSSADGKTTDVSTGKKTKKGKSKKAA